MSFINKKGFALAELLLCILITCLLTLMTLGRSINLSFEYRQFMNEYLKAQSECMAYKQTMEVGYGLRLNAMGHISQAKTLSFVKHWVIVHLGNGYLTYE